MTGMTGMISRRREKRLRAGAGDLEPIGKMT
jgi:hypothetical protein